MKPRDDREFGQLPQEVRLEIDRLCNRFEQSWRSGQAIRAEALLKELAVAHRRAGLVEMLPLEIEYRRRSGKPLTAEELVRRFPTVPRDWLEQQLLTDAHQTSLAASVEPAAFDRVPEILGDYRILSKLGGGGMGAVYRAVHERMGRQVALKVLRPEIQNDPGLQQRFNREVRAAARLSHPNIVTALDARDHAGLHFLVTELVEGSDLDHHVRQHGPLTVSQALDVLQQAARGLAYAHGKGVIHRDIKPANLLMSRDGVIKILDMGLARIEAEESGGRIDSGLTDTGVVMGTAAYMAPEQARDTHRADARSDVYSLGCTLHFLLTGKPVYVGASAVDTILSHVSQPVPSLRKLDPKVPVTLDSLFQQMIAKEPSQRTQTASEVAQRLEEIRAQGLDSSESAELRDLVAMMTTTSAAEARIGPEATALQFSPAPVPKTIRRSRRTPLFRRRITAAACGLLLLATGTGIWQFFANGGGRSQSTSVPEQSPFEADDARLSSTLVSDIDLASTSPNLNSTSPPSSTPEPLSGDADTGWRFNGQNGYLSIPSVVPRVGQAYTLEAIVRMDRHQLANVISWLGPNWMALYIAEDGRIGSARRIGNEPFVRTSEQMLTRDQWTHLATTFDGQESQLFVDGRRVSLDRIEFTLPEANGGVYVGGVDPARLPRDQNQRFFAGTIRACRISEGVRYRDNFNSPHTLPPDTTTIMTLQNVAGQIQAVNNSGEPIPIIVHNVTNRTR